MKRTLCALSLPVLLVLAAPAQIIIKKQPVPPEEVVQQAESRFDTLFYKAFYLENGEKKPEQAARFYREYLERTGGKGRFVKKSAGRLARILRRRGDEEGAAALAERFGLGKPDPKQREIREIRKRIRELRRSQDPAAAAELQALEKKLAELRGAGDRPGKERERWLQQAVRRIERLQEQIKRMEAAGEGGRRLDFMKRILERQQETLEKVKSGDMEPPSPRGGRRGFGRRPSLEEMNPEERHRLVKRFLDRARQGVARMKEQGREEQARELEARIEQAEKLVGEGKWAELQEMFRQLLRRRPRGSEGRNRPPEGELRRGFRPGGGGRR